MGQRSFGGQGLKGGMFKAPVASSETRKRNGYDPRWSTGDPAWRSGSEQGWQGLPTALIYSLETNGNTWSKPGRPK